MTDYPYAKFAILVSAVLVLSCGQSESQNQRRKHVGVSKIEAKHSIECITRRCAAPSR